MDVDPNDKTTYTTQYQEAILNYVEKDYCVQHR